MFEGPPRTWDDYAEQLRKQLPAAPEPLLDAYVRWVPWLAMVFGGICLFFLLTLGLLGAVLSPFLVLLGAEGIGTGLLGLITLALGIFASLVDIVGGYRMLQRRMSGWWLIALALAVSALSSILSFAIFGLLIIALFAYVHLQVKPRYT